MSRYLEALRAVAAAAQPQSADRFRWFGRVSDGVPPPLRDLTLVRPDVAADHLRSSLTHRLYVDFYGPGAARSTAPPRSGSPQGTRSRTFLDAITRANRGTGQLQDGWRLIGVAHQELTINRDGITLRASIDDLNLDPDVPVQVGELVSLRLPNGLTAFSPGFATILGNQQFDNAGPVIRFYWNLHPWGVPGFIESITSALNDRNIPFSLKVVSDPGGYNRCDSAVLRLHRVNLEQALPALRAAYERLRGDLKQPVPALTSGVAPGVGFADEPQSGMSFGLHRCAIIAAGLVSAWKDGLSPVATIVDAFTSEGIDIDRPYLNQGSLEEPDISLAPAVTYQVSRPDPEDRIDRFLEVAVAIGEEICLQAIWRGDRCNWLGVQPRQPGTPFHHGMTWKSLEPDLYDGTSGVALYLAEMAVAADDDHFRRTALGAMRHSLSRTGTIDSRLHLGLFIGITGIALAAGTVTKLLDDIDMLPATRKLVAGTANAALGELEHDLVSGMSGGVIALLAMHAEHGWEEALDIARTVGDRLVTDAQPADAGLAWHSTSRPSAYPLTGVSHGAAGTAVALLELWHVTGVDRYRDVAEQALEFEQAWFDAGTMNWPDFRNAYLRAGTPETPFEFATHWCHGAPGIALSRLRAWQLTGDEQYRAQAIIALQTTERAVMQTIHDGTGNYSVCHGLAGNAEILLRGYHALGDEFDHLKAAALRVASEGVRLYSEPGHEWPCGTHGGWTPGLMLGIAGIGRFYLYTADPSLPRVIPPGLS